jgi:polysaccharide biosynthesis protein VpsQ
MLHQDKRSLNTRAAGKIERNALLSQEDEKRIALLRTARHNARIFCKALIELPCNHPLNGDTNMKWFTLIFFCFLCLIVFLADAGRLPVALRVVYAYPGGDKVGHFFLMGGLNFLVNMSLPLRWAVTRPSGYLLASAAVALLVTAEELSQMLFTTRTFSVADLAADYAGIVCFGLLAYRFRIMRTSTVTMPETGPENRSQTKESPPL